MPSCAMRICKNHTKKTKGSNIRYFRFPRDSATEELWINACKRNTNFNVRNSYVCSVHFEPEDYELTPQQRVLQYISKTGRILKPTAVPRIGLSGIKRKHVESTEHAEGSPKKQGSLMSTMTACSTTVTTSTQVFSTSSQVTLENIGASPKITLKTAHDLFEESVYAGSPNDYPNLFSDGKTDDKNLALKNKCEELTKRNLDLQIQMEAMKANTEQYLSCLNKIFTPGQIRLLLNPKEPKILWCPGDIASAISLRSVSPKAYHYLRKQGYPLPGLSTLRDWANRFNVDRGTLGDVMEMLKVKGRELNELERLTVLTFDEIYISNDDRGTQEVIGQHRACQVVMATGLLSKWKQPVYYDYDRNMSKEVMSEIISKLHDASFIVVAVSSHTGSGNLGFWKEIGIGFGENVYFSHPVDETLKVHVFADVPHLLKLLRNHLLDHGCTVDGIKLDQTCFERLLTASRSNLITAFKITRLHLDLKGAERQHVQLAAQLFSNQTSKAIQWCGENSDLMNGTNWKECHKTIKLINDWFDLFNARSKFGSHSGTNAFGVALEYQMYLLELMNSFITSMRVGTHKHMIQFQKGILLTNASLVSLYKYLHEKYNVEYIITYRLNQDVLENFFSYVRGMGSANKDPSPLDMKYRLKCYILEKTGPQVSEGALTRISGKHQNVSLPNLAVLMRGMFSTIFQLSVSDTITTGFGRIIAWILMGNKS